MARVLTTPRGLANVSVSENNVWSLLLHKVILSLKNFGKTLQKVHFCITKMARKRICRFWNACSRAKTYVILTSLNYLHFYASYCWSHQFLWRPRMSICKVQKLCINSAWIAWLIYAFLPVKTWLFIVCNTAFYAIMAFSSLLAELLRG